jgi:hypothetical protein
MRTFDSVPPKETPTDLSPVPICPSCGLPGVPILYGYPTEAAMERACAGLAALGGCVVRPGMDDCACPREHRWRRASPRPDAAAPALFSADDLAAVERDYRSAWSDLVAKQGETGSQARVLAHALAIILAASGRLSEARAVYESTRLVHPGERLDALEELHRRVRHQISQSHYRTTASPRRPPRRKARAR